MSKAAPYSEAQVRHWLHWLAHNMQARSQTVFMVEELQPSWLRRSDEDILATKLFGQSDAYMLVSGILYAIPVTLLLLYWFPQGGAPSEVLIFSLILIAIPVIGRWLCLSANWSKKLVRWAIAICAFPEVFLLSAGSNNGIEPDSLSFWLYIVMAGGMYSWIAVSKAGRSELDFIQPVESMSFSLASGWEAFCSDWSWYKAFVTWYVYWPYRVVKGIQGAIQPNRVSMKIKPNAGIWMSLRNATQFLIPGLVFLLLGKMHAEEWYLLAYLALPLGLYLALEKGTVEFVDHFILRLMLRLYGYAPMDYVRFLDYAATELGFLQKVGGGYIFMHRYLLEYFSSIQEDAKA
ncbi:MAG: hypothetical protein NTW74_24335 [Acidobacteria bacterium]|nr:hypothetical protein [Acidobacteriota bacterium]